MFKIESYIAPLLMGYIDKYVKLRTEDFQLSLWGGDVVLNNLDLRLDVIEQAIQLPIIFKSGHIHELRMHVPWTKLRSEPVVVTINTIECILKVRDTGYDDNESAKSGSSGIPRSASQQKLKLKQKPEAPDLPPGYLQSLVNKIVNNVNIVVNNLILKFVEDDIVLSINVKSAECYSVDKDWARGFVELSPLDLILRKVVSFCDLTVCLDKSDASGKIEMYQDPVVYRSSITCRLHTMYESLHSKFPSVTKLNIFCDKLELTLTDTQLPMFIRLIQLCLAIYYGMIDMSGTDGDRSDEPVNQEVIRTEAMGAALSPLTEIDVGWGEWAWSFVPQILPEEEEGEGGDGRSKGKPAPPIITIGLYIPKASVTFKLTESIRESIHYGPNKVTFKPLLHLEAEGIGLEILAEGLRFFNVQSGVTNLRVTAQGECVCGQDDSKHPRSSVLLAGGSSLSEPRPLSYTSQSLFDPLSPENQGETTVFITRHDEHMEMYTEKFGLEKFGFFWFDYIYTVDIPADSKHGSKSSASGDIEECDTMKENAFLRFLFGQGTLNLSSSLVHRVKTFLYCAGNHQYEPYGRTVPDQPNEDRAPPSDPQIQALEEFIPTRTYHLTFVQPIINLLYAEHAQCDVKKKKRSSSSKKSQKGKSSSTTNPAQTQSSLPALRATANRFDLQITTAMYGNKLVSMVSKMAGPSSNLLHHCYSHTQIKLFSFQIGLTRIDSSGTSDSVLTVLPACSGALYKRSLLNANSWQNLHLPHVEWMYEIPSVSLSCTKPQLLLTAHIYTSWREKTPKPWLLLTNSLLEDVFKTQEGKSPNREPLFEVTITGMELKQCTTPVGFSSTGTLASLQAVLYAKAEGGDCIIPVLSAPASTKHLRSPAYFTWDSSTGVSDSKEDWITFTYQVPSSTSTAEVPAVVLMNITGLTCCLDPMIYQWLLYTPRLKSSTVTKPGNEESKIFVDLALANAASPLNQSQMSIHSESSVKDQSDSCQTPTNTQTPTQGQTQPTPTSPTPLLSAPRETLPQTASGAGLSGKPIGEESKDIWGRKCADIFPLFRILQIQVEVSSFCVFMPKSTVVLGDAGMDIGENLRGVYRSGTLPDTLVLSLPSVRLHSCGFKPLSVLQEIPISVLEGTLRGEKLPWSVQVTDTALYTLHKMRRAYPILQPADFSCTVAVSSKFSPPTSDTISALGACLHVDMTGVRLSLSAIQVQTMALLVNQINSAAKELPTFWGTALSTGTKKPPAEPGEVKNIPPSATPVMPHPAEQSTSGAEAVTTETSEEVSRETTPNRELEIEEAHSEGVKLSFWLQWTLPKFELMLYGEEKKSKMERCISVLLEELSMSIDLQEVYGKVKAKIGMAAIHHYVKTSGENSWVFGGNEGLLLSGPSTLPRNIQVVSNKQWTNDSMPSPMGSLYTMSDVMGREKNHGLMSFTFTRALCKNVKRRMRKLNVELAGLHEDSDSHVQEMLANNYRKYISEVCLTLEPCDIILFKPAVGLILDMFNYTLPRDSLSGIKHPHPPSRSQLQLGPKPLPTLRGNNSASSLKSSQSTSQIPISSASVPLLYVNLSNMRLFVPVSDNQARSTSDKLNVSEEMVRKNTSTLSHDMFLLQFSSLALNPQAENPLSRFVLEKELYRRALHAGVTQHPGSQLEDRQYQLDLKGVMFCSGVWGEFSRWVHHLDSAPASHNPTIQIPAVEWNNLVSPVQKETDIRVIPLASRFDFKVVLAPAIVYTPPAVSQKTTPAKEPLVVCGHAVEINIISDLDFYLSTSQLNLLHKMACELSAEPDVTGEDGSTSAMAAKSQTRGEQHLNDSGVESDASTANTHAHAHSHAQLDSRVKPLPVAFGHHQEAVAVTKGQKVTREMTPVDILLTAGRITCMMYSHKTQTDSIDLSTGKAKSKHCNSKTKSSDREKKAGRYGGGRKGSYRQAWSSCGYLADESSDEFEGNYDPPAHLRFMNIHVTSESNKACDEETGIVLVPFLYSYFSQPHAVISLQPDAQKVELSCYDIMLKGAAVDHIIKVDDHKLLPDCSDYATHWLETRAGSPNLKTGVPASLITVRVTDLLQGPAQICVELERPLRLSASLSKLLQVQQFMSDSVATWRTKPQAGEDNSKPERPEQTSVESPILTFLSRRVKSVEVQTEQVILYAETLTDHQTPFVLIALASVSADMELNLSDKEEISEIAGNFFAKDLILKTGFDNKARPLIGPFTVNLDCVVQWVEHSGPDWLPKVTVVTDMGLVTIEIGQEHVLCVEMLLEHLTDFMQPEGQGDDQPEASTVSHDHPGMPAMEVQKKVYEEFVVDQTRDDLKSGIFLYIVDEGEGLHPNPGEIVFGVETEAGDDTMTWSYHQPRVLSHFSVSPVPFNVSEEGSATQTAPSSQIPCTLQYWDVMAREFVDYQEFFLSEDQACLVSLAEVKPHAHDLVVALMWRVVMSPKEEEEESEERTSTSSETKSSSMVLPMSLAACICVDSCFVPSLIPTLQLSVSVSLIEIHLSNHIQHTGDAIPTKLQPFIADSSAPCDQEFAVVTIDNPAAIVSRVQGQQARTTIGISAAAQLDVVEYKFLTKQTVVESTSFHGSMTLIPEDQNVTMECAVDLQPMMVRLGKGAIHTLNSAAQAWTQLFSDSLAEPTPRVIFNHYIVCNDTQHSVRFGQVGTDENVCVLSRHLNLYSWRTQTLPQSLHLCLDGSKWQWCEPFTVAKQGTVVRRVTTADQIYTAVIRVKQLSNVHTQITISGQLVVSSRLSHTMELKMMTGPVDATPSEASVIVGPGSTAPTWVVEEGHMRSFRVRLTSIKTMWSQEVFVSGDRMKETRLVKIPLHDRGSSIHIWSHIFHQQLDGARQTLVLLSPLYVVRSHLPHPLYINIETTKLKAESQVEAPGQGRELELLCMGGDLNHQLTFQLGSHLQKSSPAVSLSSGLIEQVTRTKLDKVDVVSLCYDWNVNNNNMWPFSSMEEASSSSRTDSAVFVQHSNVTAALSQRDPQPNIDLNVSLLEYWPGCNTLLVTVSPCCLLVNHSGLDIVALTTKDDCGWWEIANGSVLAPPPFEEGLRLGVKDEEGVALSPSVSLSEEEWSVRRLRSESSHTLYTDGYVHLSIIASHQGHKQVCLLTLRSRLEQGMRILTVRERFAICSLMPATPLDLSTLAIPLGHQVSLDYRSMDCVKLKTADTKSKPSLFPLLYWRVLPGDVIQQQALSFVQYLCLRNGGKAEWACPLRVTATENGTRSTVTLPKPKDSDPCIHTIPLVVTGHLRDGVTYLVIQEDKAPSFVFHNRCAFPISFGQALLNLSASDCTVQEETELCGCVPTVQPDCNAHYTFPYLNTKFPELYDASSVPRMHIKPLIGSTDQQSWSSGIDLSREQVRVLSIPRGPDLKLHVEKVAMLTHIAVETVSKAEISAKEIRSRIKGQERSVVVTASADDSLSSLSSVPKVAPSTSGEEVQTTFKSSSLQFQPREVPASSRSRLRVSLGVFLKHFCFVMLDESSSEDSVGEVLRLNLDNTYAAYYPVSGNKPPSWVTQDVQKICLGLCIGDMQIDNQCFNKGQFDFPVIVVRQQKMAKSVQNVEEEFFNLTVIEKHAYLRRSSLIHIQLVQVESSFCGSLANDSLDVMLQPLCIYIDDCFVYRILKEVELLLPTRLSVDRHRTILKSDLPPSILVAASCGADPAVFQHLSIQPIKLLLSVHASLKVFIASDQTPLTFGRFERNQVFTTGHQLSKSLVMHYVSGAIFRAGLVVGSLDVLGNPTGLMRSVGNGVADLFRLPYAGLTRSPGAFVAGISSGMSSFLCNISAGTISSITNFAASVSRNMDRLSLDKDHFTRQELSRKTRPAGLSHGIKQGLTGFGLSLLGAVAGLADQPIQGALQRQQAESGATATATGIVSGVGKGLMGVVTKPIGGAAEFVSQTGQGFLHSTGLVKLAQQRYQPVEECWAAALNSRTKHLWKILHSLPPGNSLIMELPATQYDAAGQAVPVILLLTTDILFVLSCEEDSQQQAFTAIELESGHRETEPSVITLTWRDSIRYPVKQDPTTDRVAEFLDKSSSFVSLAGLENSGNGTSLSDSAPVSPSTETASTPQYEFHVDPNYRDLFITLLQLTKKQVLGQGFIF